MDPISIKERVVTYLIAFLMSALLVGIASYFFYGKMRNEQKERRETISKIVKIIQDTHGNHATDAFIREIRNRGISLPPDYIIESDAQRIEFDDMFSDAVKRGWVNCFHRYKMGEITKQQSLNEFITFLDALKLDSKSKAVTIELYQKWMD
jgi:hypothetical protein|nr:MAG TPA: hypothetical protein [Caudoviricetes sp.]